jgi:CPA1 family monovalent cation:H+ antiporter
LIRDLSGTERWWPLEALALAGTLLAVRVLWVFPLSAATQRRIGMRASWRVPLVVSWSGARGVLPLAAALSIPLTNDAGAALPYRGLVLLLTTAVIVFSLTIQGFTLAPLVRRTGIALTPDDTTEEDVRAKVEISRVALAHLETLSDLEAAPDPVIDRLRRELHGRIEHLEPRTGDGRPDPMAATYRHLRRDLIAVETAELNRLYETGSIGDTTRRHVQRILDLEEAGLDDDRDR